ncbi:zinc ribbon domain-containing protein [Sulfurisphaera ohwakuensis]|uniref:zinc ribbon domain-containing protein n=1 Tax=Sulfurisphaera ohwakuensis TaxID=69656 RepID=UPI0036F21CD8
MNNPIYSYICQPVGIGTKVIQLPLYRPLNTKELSKDLVLYLRGQGYRVYSTYSPNIIVLQVHAVGIRSHYYTIKICQSSNFILIESGITNGRVELERAGLNTGLGITDEFLHSSLFALFSGVLAGVDVASVLGSYEEENKILSGVQQIILYYENQGFQYSCPHCGMQVERNWNYCPHCGRALNFK